MSEPRRAIALFAKAPTPGFVKTRLVPPLSAEEAADLALAFLIDSTAAMLRAAARCDAQAALFYSPADAAPWFRSVLGERICYYPQREGDLTERLAGAYRTLAEAGCDTVCFIGADSPTLPEGTIDAAFAGLREHDLAIGPAQDGGYYLLAMRAANVEIFSGIAWSTEHVLQQTRAAAQRLGLSVSPLPMWYDVDDESTLHQLIRELAICQPHDDSFDARETREYLARRRFFEKRS